jgi:hypothetical protein
MKQARLAFWVLYEQIEDLQLGSTDRKTSRRTPIFHLPPTLWEEETELTLPPLLSNEHRSKRRKVGGHSGPFALTKGMVNEVYQLLFLITAHRRKLLKNADKKRAGEDGKPGPKNKKIKKGAEDVSPPFFRAPV